jgi:mRNA interferase MazF
VRRCEIYLADLGKQIGIRPVLVVSNDDGNRTAPHVTVLTLSSSEIRLSKNLPTHIKLKAGESGLRKDSVVLAEQFHTIQKVDIIHFIGVLDEIKMKDVDSAMRVQIALLIPPTKTERS